MHEKIKKLRNGKTINATKAEGLSRKIQAQKFVSYPHFFLDLLQLFGNCH